ncbi:hypothetical protein IFT66_07925 [Rhizobium sp. CFBP 13726]|uniref:hypothetical protein n=1 Tax=Rhizobium sp. CFBP 13726 TaxID=2775296 RepID=UPI0017817F77|nr:hypothetical protein [Rhizobium sp. CFBP 13726]MBD8651003.1 hypothetical protein [Rhizobium sp. CFBP 13726]
MKARSIKSPARRSFPGQRALDQQRYTRLFVPANTNGANAPNARPVSDAVDFQEGPFVETPLAFDAALPVFITLFLTMAIAVELLVLLPITREGLRCLTILFH